MKSTSVICVFLLFLTVFACDENEKQQETKKEEMEDYTGPMLTFKNIETIYSQDADVKLKAEAPIRLRMQNMDEIFPEGAHITIYDIDGAVKTTLVADSAIYLDQVQTWTMVGNVKVRNEQENQQLETTLLNWDNRLREIYTNDKVKITTASELIYGVGLRARQDFSQYKIAKPTGVFSIDETSTQK